MKKQARLTAQQLNSLKAICPGHVAQNVSLSQFSRWKIGGLADVVVIPRSSRELVDLRSYLGAQGIPHVFIGGSTNLLFSDRGLRVVCVHIGQHFSNIKIVGKSVQVEAGAWVPLVARKIMMAGLTGAEHIAGIPGSMGGLVYMNGGSQRKSIGASVSTISYISSDGVQRVRTRDECLFGYRSSIFQQTQDLIVEVGLEFSPANSVAEVRSEMLHILAERRRKFPKSLPSCGSVFVSDPVMYAQFGPPGAVIEQLGFKGLRVGDAEVSRRHANFIINVGSARSTDVISLVDTIRTEVLRNFGVTLRAEGQYISEFGKAVPLHDASQFLAEREDEA